MRASLDARWGGAQTAIDGWGGGRWWAGATRNWIQQTEIEGSVFPAIRRSAVRGRELCPGNSGGGRDWGSWRGLASAVDADAGRSWLSLMASTTWRRTAPVPWHGGDTDGGRSWSTPMEAPYDGELPRFRARWSGRHDHWRPPPSPTPTLAQAPAHPKPLRFHCRREAPVETQPKSASVDPFPVASNKSALLPLL